MPQFQLTSLQKKILVAWLAAFLLVNISDQFGGTQLNAQLGLSPRAWLLEGKFWQVFTYSWIHRSVIQLFFNGMVLVFLGGELERLWGTRRFLTFFLGAGVLTGVLYAALAGMMGSSVAGGPATILGPMGPIYAMLVVYGILFAERTLHFMMLFPLKAKHFVWLLGGLEFMNTIFTPGGLYWGLANVSGMAAGYLLLKGQVIWVRYRQKRMDLDYVRKKKKAQTSLRLVVNKGDPEERDAPRDPKTWH